MDFSVFNNDPTNFKKDNNVNDQPDSEKMQGNLDSLFIDNPFNTGMPTKAQDSPANLTVSVEDIESADTSKLYAKYVSDVEEYKASLSKEEALERELAQLKESGDGKAVSLDIRQRIKNASDNLANTIKRSIDNTEAEWKKHCTESEKKAAELRTKVLAETNRLNKVQDDAEKAILKDIDAQEAILKSKISNCKSDVETYSMVLEKSKNYTANSWKHNEAADAILQKACNRKWLSPSQQDIMQMPAEELIEKWSLFSERSAFADNALEHSELMNNILNGCVPDKIYKRFCYTIEAVIFVTLLIMQLISGSEIPKIVIAINEIICSVIGFIIGFFILGTLVQAVFVSIFNSEKTKENTSKTSLIYNIVGGILGSWLFGGILMHFMKTSKILSVILCALIMIPIVLVFNSAKIKKFITSQDFMIGKGVKAILGDTAKYDEAITKYIDRLHTEFLAIDNIGAKRYELKTKVVSGIMDAVICNYIRNKEMLEYLTKTGREEINRSVDEKIMLANQGIDEANKKLEELNKSRSTLNGQIDKINQKRAEAEAYKESEFAKINRQYGIKATPNCSNRSSWLKEDKADVERCEEIIKKLNTLETVHMQINSRNNELYQWDKLSASLPPVKNSNGEYIYKISDDSVIRTNEELHPSSKTAAVPTIRPFLLSHKCSPVTFVCGSCDRWSDTAIELIAEIWQGLRKSTPANLLDFTVIDPTLRTRDFIGRPKNKLRALFAKNYRMGIYENDSLLTIKAAEKVSLVKGVYERNDIEAFADELIKKSDKINSYIINHNMYDDGIEAANKHKAFDEHGDHNVIPYHIVFIVLNGEIRNSIVSDRFVNAIISNIEEKNCSLNGLLPIFILSENFKKDNSSYLSNLWCSLAEVAVKKGQVYRVDMTSLTISARK